MITLAYSLNVLVQIIYQTWDFYLELEYILTHLSTCKKMFCICLFMVYLSISQIGTLLVLFTTVSAVPESFWMLSNYLFSE